MSYPYTLDLMFGSESSSPASLPSLSPSIKKPYAIINALIAQAPVGGSKIIQALSPQLDSEKQFSYTFTKVSGSVEGTSNKFSYSWSGEGENNILTVSFSLSTPSDIYQITDSVIKELIIKDLTSSEKTSLDSVLSTSSNNVSIDLLRHSVTIDGKAPNTLKEILFSNTSSASMKLTVSSKRILREYVPMSGSKMLVYGVMTADTELDPTGIGNLVNALLNNEGEGYKLICSREAFILSDEEKEYTQGFLTEIESAGMQETDKMAFLEYIQYLFDIGNVITDPSSISDPSQLPEEGAIVDMTSSFMVYLGTKMHEFCTSTNNNLSKAEANYQKENKAFPSA